MTTIYGYEREILRSRLIASRLRDEGRDIDGALECHLNILIGSVRDPAWLKAYAATCAAIDVDIHNPAKLAEMLAEEGRRLGFNVINRLPHDDTLPFADIYAVCDCVSIATSILWQECIFGDVAKKLTMPQARELLSKWLQLPDGAHGEAEKALRGES